MLEGQMLVAMVPVDDVERARSFYGEVLGLEVVSADDYGCVLKANGSMVRLSRVDGYERPPHTIVGWEVRSIADTIAALVAAGVEMRRYEGMGQDPVGVWPAPSGDRVAWFPDSEGNTLSLTQAR
jgi:catechol 2,3-dioxygenase-like lactoylglutathione lyase family enzyme